MLDYSLEFSTETLEEDYVGANSPFNDDLACHVAVLDVFYSDSKAKFYISIHEVLEFPSSCAGPYISCHGTDSAVSVPQIACYRQRQQKSLNNWDCKSA